MKKHLILLVAWLLCRQLLPAQNLNAYYTGNINMTWFSWPCTGAEDPPWPLPSTNCQNNESKIQTEYPPFIIGGGWRTYFFTNGTGSSVASHPNSMLPGGQLNFKNNGTSATEISRPTGCGSLNVRPEAWRLEYYSAYSAQAFDHPTAGPVSVAFVEGENYELPGVNEPVTGCGFQDGLDNNRTFLCLAWTPNTLATNWGQQYFTDMGPIIWPATGYYFPNGHRSSYGCGNNTTIQANGYLYVFYKDMSMDDGVPGHQAGIKVARAPISDALNPLAYQTFYEDASGIHWNQSMPAGFDKSNIQNFYTTPGPQGTPIIETSRDYTRFAVAKVNGTNYYMGLGNYPDPDPSHVWYGTDGKPYSPQITTLKYSYDLLHWFGDRTIYTAPSYKLSQFNYPIFLNANGWTNTDIDPNNFYIIGTQPENPNINNRVYNLNITTTPPPDPTDPTDPGPQVPTICYDENGNETFCPPARKATNGATPILDNSKGRAPFVYPNPGPGVFRLNYTLKGQAKTQVNVLDLMGRQVQTGSAMNRMAGTYTETVNISGHAKGVYMLEVVVNGVKKTFKVIYQ